MNLSTYTDSQHDHLCRCPNCRPQPPEHPETCGCVECVEFVRFSGQVDPCGWTMSVTWSLDDNLAHAEGQSADDIRRLFARTSGDTPDEDMLTYGQREMEALIRRIEGKYFESADRLHSYLRHDLGLSRDFD